MKLPWINAQQHADALKAKDSRIAALEAELKTAREASSDDTVTRLSALFGESAKAEDFDLVAAVESIQEAATENAKELEASQSQLQAANAQLNGIAKLVGEKSAEGVDLVEKVAKLEPEHRTNPLDKKDKKIQSKEKAAYECEVDEEIRQANASFAIPPHHRN